MTIHKQTADAVGDLRHCIAIASQTQPDWRPVWEDALQALRQEPDVPSLEEVETLTVARLIAFANAVQGESRAKRLTLACSHTKELTQATIDLFRRRG